MEELPLTRSESVNAGGLRPCRAPWTQRSGTANVVFKPHGASFLVHPLLPQAESRAVCGRRQEWYSAAEQNGNQRHLYCIDQPRTQKASEELSTSEQCDIFPGFSAKFRNHPLSVSMDGDVGIVAGPQGM